MGIMPIGPFRGEAEMGQRALSDIEPWARVIVKGWCCQSGTNPS
jgi:hypothetical protein